GVIRARNPLLGTGGWAKAGRRRRAPKGQERIAPRRATDAHGRQATLASTLESFTHPFAWGRCVRRFGDINCDCVMLGERATALAGEITTEADARGRKSANWARRVAQESSCDPTVERRAYRDFHAAPRRRSNPLLLAQA